MDWPKHRSSKALWWQVTHSSGWWASPTFQPAARCPLLLPVAIATIPALPPEPDVKPPVGRKPKCTLLEIRTSSAFYILCTRNLETTSHFFFWTATMIESVEMDKRGSSFKEYNYSTHGKALTCIHVYCVHIVTSFWLIYEPIAISQTN